MKLFKRQESDETDFELYEAVNLLSKEDVEELLLIYLYNYIIFNDSISDLKRKFIKERADSELRKVFVLFYDKKKISEDEYVSKISQILNNTVPSEWVDDIIAISYGLYQRRCYIDLKESYKFRSDFISIGSICEKILADKLNRGEYINESKKKTK